MTTETCDQSLFSLFDRAVEHRERTSPDRLCLAEIAAGQKSRRPHHGHVGLDVLADLVEPDSGRS